ncbi:MAG: hypothetical protein IKA48_02690 [Fibrobacter sp.]|nr:hypothetical protein [Fibrobacter sp.]
MVLEEMALAEQAKLIEASLESNKDKFTAITTKAFMSYQLEANKYVLDNRGKVEEEVLGRTVQEMLIKKISDAAIAAFQLGYTAGMAVAFDIVEAKAMEMSGGTCSTVN